MPKKPETVTKEHKADLLGQYMSIDNKYNDARQSAFERAERFINQEEYQPMTNNNNLRKNLYKVFGSLVGACALLLIVAMVAPSTFNPIFNRVDEETGEVVNSNPFSVSDVLAYYEGLEDEESLQETVIIDDGETEILQETIITQDDEEYVLVQDVETEEIITEVLIEPAGEDKLISDNPESKNAIEVEQTEGLYCSSESSYQVIQDQNTAESDDGIGLQQSGYVFSELVSIFEVNEDMVPTSETETEAVYEVEGWVITVDKETKSIVSATETVTASDSIDEYVDYNFSLSLNVALGPVAEELEPVNDKMLTPNGAGCYVESEEVAEELSETFVELEEEKEVKIAAAETPEEAEAIANDLESIITSTILQDYEALYNLGKIDKGQYISVIQAEKYGLTLEEQITKEERVAQVTEEYSQLFDQGLVNKDTAQSEIGAVQEGVSVEEYNLRNSLMKELSDITTPLSFLGLVTEADTVNFTTYTSDQLRYEITKYQAMLDAQQIDTGSDTGGVVTGTLDGYVETEDNYIYYADEPYYGGFITGNISSNLNAYAANGGFVNIYPSALPNGVPDYGAIYSLNVTVDPETGVLSAR